MFGEARLVGMCVEARELESAKTGKTWRRVLNVECGGCTAEVVVDEGQYKDVSKLAGEFVDAQCRVAAGMNGSADFVLVDIKPLEPAEYAKIVQARAAKATTNGAKA